MSKKYWVQVNCASFHNYLVTADSMDEAKDEAERRFQCDSTEGEASTDSRIALPDDEGEEIESMRQYRTELARSNKGHAAKLKQGKGNKT